jgi:hypothetical protein
MSAKLVLILSLVLVEPDLYTHGDSSERSLDSPKDQCSIGFQPVFFCSERMFYNCPPFPARCVQKIRVDILD